MVFLALTPTGLTDALRAAERHDFVWCGSDAIPEAEYAMLKQSNLSRFVHEVGDSHLIADAVGTIEEHHPGQTIWVEAKQS